MIDIFDCGMGCECFEGVNLSDIFFVVFFFNVLNDFVMMFFVKVDIDIWCF